jgi:hypothetical protein
VRFAHGLTLVLVLSLMLAPLLVLAAVTIEPIG